MAGKASSLKALHQQALDRFKLVARTEEDQRARELEDLKFHAGDQWPSDVVSARQGTPASASQGAQPVPARPMLTIRSLDQPIAQVINQARNARQAIKISPKDQQASKETADILGGLCRAIEYESHAQTAYLWAYQRAVIAGRGYFRINKAWSTEDSSSWDQVLTVESILNGSSVYLDPWAQVLNDPKAAMWGFITDDIPEDRYKREYGDTDLANGIDEEALVGLGDQRNTWILAEENGQRIFRIAEYFYVVEESSDETHPDDPTITRQITSRKVMWAKLNGIEFIDKPQEWDGTYIPIIPVIGSELNIGGQRRWEGMVRPAMDPCRMLNYMVTSTAEQVGLSTRAPYIMYKGQMEGMEDAWMQSNTRNQPALEVNATTDETGNNILPLPQRNVAEPPIQALTQAVSLFTNFIRSTTGVPDAALGHVNPNDRSGKAIAQLQQASEQGTSNFPDNLQRAIQHGGCVLLDLIPKIYDRPGRIAHVLTGQDDAQSAVMLNQPFYRQGGQPQALEPGQQPPQQPVQPGMPPVQPPIEHFDLSKGKYAVVVETGKNFATRRQEANAAMLELAQAEPQLLPRYADLLVKSMDFPEADAIAERLKPPGTDDGSLPPQIQAAIGQMQAENQQLKQMLQTKQLENQTKLQEAQMETASREKIAMINASAQLAAVGAKIDAENARTFVDAFEQRIGKALDLHMQHVQAAMDRIHETHTQARDHAHNVGMAQIGHQQALEQGQQAHEQGTDLAVTQAALTPEPASAESAS
jgi:hypothetical protein